MWMTILCVVSVLAIISIIYLVRQFHRFRALERLAEKHKLLSWILALLPVLLLGTAIPLFGMSAAVVIVIHLMVIWLCCNFTAFVIRRITHKEDTRNYAGGAAILITVGVFITGWYFAHHVYETDYRLTTKKSLGGEPLRIAMLADSHLSVTLSGADFAEQLDRIAAAEPDLLLICGDFVDDSTQTDDMLTACEALGKLQLPYGVYFSFGNHDEGYFRYRKFTPQDLRDTLTENHVQILEDTCIIPDSRIALIGRQDTHVQERASAEALAENLDDSLYQIVLDHQPNDYDAEAAAGFDLVLSGHTHGGHIFPAGYVGLLIGANDALYGLETREHTDYIVTSGISGWAIPFKTGCISEYCIIDVEPE